MGIDLTWFDGAHRGRFYSPGMESIFTKLY